MSRSDSDSLSETGDVFEHGSNWSELDENGIRASKPLSFEIVGNADEPLLPDVMRWAPSARRDLMSYDCGQVAGRLMLACVEPGQKRTQFIDSIAHMAEGTVCDRAYRGEFKQGAPEMASDVHALTSLLADAEDGDLFIIDVDVPYYSQILDDCTIDDDTDGDVVDDWRIVVKLIERYLSNAENKVNFVIITTAFDGRLLPRTLVDLAGVRVGAGEIGALQKMTLFNNPDEYDETADEDWVAGDPLTLQIEASDGRWLGGATLTPSAEILEKRRELREKSRLDSKPVSTTQTGGAWSSLPDNVSDSDALPDSVVSGNEGRGKHSSRLLGVLQLAACASLVLAAVATYVRKHRG